MDWLGGADNPFVTFKQLACPAAFTAKGGCFPQNDGINKMPTASSTVPTYTA